MLSFLTICVFTAEKRKTVQKTLSSARRSFAYKAYRSRRQTNTFSFFSFELDKESVLLSLVEKEREREVKRVCNLIPPIIDSAIAGGDS